ncbi:MAG TPA: Ldh family oxidoreductase [Candidatus Saccharimonas sp.]|nr:Ldh family oxidoreductase [Candidatus Saccharimonas sp.]
MKIALKTLRPQVIATLSQNLSPDAAARLADFLIWADMAGVPPMGIAKLTGTEPMQNIKPAQAVRVVRDTKLSQLIDAGGHPAPLVSLHATEVAITKAKEHGFGLVGAHNMHSSNGVLGYYVDQIAKQGLIGLMVTRTPGSQAPFGSAEPLFGTNPLAIGIPTAHEPLVIDMATSSMTWSGLTLAKARGEQLPEGKAIGPDGQPTTDPAQAMEGGLLPFDGGYKGSSLAMVVEILGGPLVGASYGVIDDQWGTLVMAIDPGLVSDPAEFKRHTSDLVRLIKASRKQPGVDDIRLPGDRLRAAHQAAQDSGEVDIDETVLKELKYI